MITHQMSYWFLKMLAMGNKEPEPEPLPEKPPKLSKEEKKRLYKERSEQGRKK